MGEGEHRRRRIRGSRGAYLPATDSPAVPAGREPVEPAPAQATAPDEAGPEAVTPAPAPVPPARPTPATGRTGFRAMFGARPGPGPVPTLGPPASAPAPPVPAPPVPAPPVPAERSRPPARPGIDRPPALDRELIDAHAVTPGSEDHERGLRGLIGGGASQVSVTAAMRARDAARPTAEDIAAAEASLTIVHRGWVPRDP